MRPLPNVLSEREVLLKMADIAVAEGVLDPSYIEYQNNPALEYAKIETPILLTDAGSGVPDTYILHAVDNDGITLARISVSSNPNVDAGSFEYGRHIALPGGAMNHLMTKREAAEFIQSQFPDDTVSEPMMIANLRLGENPYSRRAFLWYFTVSENARSAAGTGGDYVIDAYFSGYYYSPNGARAWSAGNLRGGSPYLDGAHIVKLDKSLHFFDRLNMARSAGGVTFTPPAYPTDPPIGFTPVPVK